jgi:hypothetical protein
MKTQKGFSNNAKEKLKICFTCANKVNCKNIGFTDTALNSHIESAKESMKEAFTFDDILLCMSFVGKTIVHPTNKKQYKIKCILPNILDCEFRYKNQKGGSIYLRKEQICKVKFI